MIHIQDFLQREFRRNEAKPLQLPNKDIVLVGAGRIGQGAQKVLQENGYRTIAYCDNNRKIVGNVLYDIPIMSVEEAIESFGRQATFIITLFNIYAWAKEGDYREDDPRSDLMKRGCCSVLYYSELFRLFGKEDFRDACATEWFLPISELLHESEDILQAYELMEEESKEIYYNILKSRVYSDEGWKIHHVRTAQYFCDLTLPIPENMTFVDCGGFDGDTLGAFLSYTGEKFARYFYIEPDDGNRKKFAAAFKMTKELKRKIEILPYAVGAEDGRISFSNDSNASSRCLEDSPQDDAEQIEVIKMDRYFAEDHVKWIKMDIEGGNSKHCAEQEK